jgi:Asp-tRNA(Asn)/Glu-tRNA(Gln) amidotransferase A subunit family amidase
VRGLPIGLQLVGPRFEDARVLQAAAWFERDARASGAASPAAAMGQ